METQTLVQQLGNKQRKRRPRKDVLEVSQNSHSTASGDTRLREEIGLGGKFKGVTKFTQYSTASVQQLGDKHAERRPMREELGSRFARTSSCRRLASAKSCAVFGQI